MLSPLHAKHIYSSSTRKDSLITTASDLATSHTDSDASFDTSGLTRENEVLAHARNVISFLQRSEHELHKRVRKCIKHHKHRAHEVFVADICGWTPFHAITLRGDKKTIKMMLNSGVDVNHRMGDPGDLPSGCTPLHVAAYRGNLKVIKCILSRGGHVNVRNSADLTPIYYAVTSENMEAVNLLLTYGADIRGLQTSEPLVNSNKTKPDMSFTPRDKTLTKPAVLCGLSSVFTSRHRKS